MLLIFVSPGLQAFAAQRIEFRRQRFDIVG